MTCNTVIRKVKNLEGRAKDLAEKYGWDLEPEKLVIVTVSLEMVEGDPVSFLLDKIQSSKEV